MALVIGNKTASLVNPNSGTQTWSHNQNVGAGVAMTLVRNQNMGALSQRQAMYILQAPSTGANNIVASYSGSQFNGTSLFAVSFLGAGGVDTHAGTALLGSPNSQSANIVAGSVIYASGVSTQAMSNYSIGGTTRTLEFQHNINDQVGGALSATGLSAGATDVTTITVSGDVTNSYIAILEAGVAPATRRRIHIT